MIGFQITFQADELPYRDYIENPIDLINDRKAWWSFIQDKPNWYENKPVELINKNGCKA